jgi:chemotaxis protein CheY-P-specific phosphatase CheC
MTMIDKIDKKPLDVARPVDHEMSRIGEVISSIVAGTSKSLAMMTGEQYDYSFRTVGQVTTSYLDNMTQLFKDEVCAVYLRADGEVTVGMMLFLTHIEARHLARRLLGNRDMEQLDALGKSSISEVGNILFAGSFLNDMSKTTGFKMSCSVPGLAIDNLIGIIEMPVTDIATTEQELIIAESELCNKSGGITIKVLIIMGFDDARKLQSAAAAPTR